MSCREYRGNLVEWARGINPPQAAAAHVSGCPGCAQFLQEQQALETVLRRVATEEIPSPDEYSARILAEFDRSARKKKVRVLGWFGAAAVSAAACLTLSVTPVRPVTALQPAPEAAQFVPIPYTVPLAPEEPATVVRMEISVSALLAAGFQMPAEDPSDTVQADVLVSQDGRARAIRPVSVLNTN